MTTKPQSTTKSNLQCADVILRRSHLEPTAWIGLRRDIAIALTLAEQEVKRGAVKPKRKRP